MSGDVDLPPFKRARLARSLAVRIGLAWLLMGLALAFYWQQLLASLDERQAQGEAQIVSLASASAHALALQADTLFAKIDYVTVHLVEHWRQGDPRKFRETVDFAQHALPAGAVVQVAVADAEGRVVYSNLVRSARSAEPSVSIADREHFRVHLQADRQPALFVSAPVFGRVSGEWTVQFSRPVIDDGAIRGVLVLSISTAHLSEALRDIFPDAGDVAFLVRQDGAYLARSRQLIEVAGKAVPNSRDWIRDPALRHGVFETLSPIDGIYRLYAWHRLPRYPALVGVGLHKSDKLAPMAESAQAARTRNLVGSGLLLLVFGGASYFWFRRERAAAQLDEARERLELALEGGNFATWDWSLDSGEVHHDWRWWQMMGLTPGRHEEGLDLFISRVHPRDIGRVRALLDANLAGYSDQYEAEYRVRRGDGSWIWLHDRGRVVARDEAGRPLRVTGTTLDVTDSVQAGELKRALLDQSAAAIVLVNQRREVVEYNRRADEIFGTSERSAGTLLTRDRYVDEASFESIAALYRRLPEEGTVRTRLPLRDRNGATRWFDLQGVMRNPDESESDVIWTLIDVTEMHAAQQALQIERQRLATVLRRVPGGVLVIDEQARVVMINEAFCRLFGLDVRAEQLVGIGHQALCERFAGNLPDWLCPASALSPAEPRRHFEISLPDGKVLEVDRVQIEYEQRSFGQVWVIRDVSTRKQREAELARIASTDFLTELPNRRSFMAHLEAVCEDVRQHGHREVALLMLDIDHFKRVNDTYGHAVGDQVLRHLAETLRGSLREGDLAGRLGGEEFAVLLAGVSSQDAPMLAERIRAAVAGSSASTDAGAVSVTISIGLAMVDGASAERVLSRADDALYEAKALGRDRVIVSQT